MLECRKAATMRRRGLFGLSVLAVVLSVGVGVWLWQTVELSSVSRVAEQVEQLKPVAGAIRLALIGLLAVFWPRLVDLAWRFARVNEGKRAHLLAQRWRVVGWLLVIELVLGQNLVLGAQGDACSAPGGCGPGMAPINPLGRVFAVTTGPAV
jgi:hypothetical protein